MKKLNKKTASDECKECSCKQSKSKKHKITGKEAKHVTGGVSGAFTDICT